jgi:hypothetical protein
VKAIRHWILLVSFPGLLAALPAAAQVSAFESFYEERAQTSCAGDNCVLHFSALAENTLIKHVKCLFVHTGNVRTFAIGVTDTSTGTIFRRLQFLGPLVAPVVYTGSNWYSMNFDTDFLMGAGKYPAIGADTFPTSTGGSLSCTISGRVWSDSR